MSGPTEEKRRKPAYIQKRDETQRLAWEREEHQQAIDAINAVANQLATDQNQQNSADAKRGLREKVTIGLLIGTVIVAGIGDVIFYLTMGDARRTAAIVHIDNGKALGQAARAASDNAKDAERTRIESSRAWVGPGTATIDAVPALGQPVVASIGYQNSGREPARNFTWFGNPLTYKVADDAKFTPGIIDYMTKCLRTPPRQNAGVVYPTTGFNGNTLRITYAGSGIDQGVVAGKKALIIEGCFTYVTFGQAHHSAFCFFYVASPPVVLKPGETAKPPNTNLSNCNNGSNAD